MKTSNPVFSIITPTLNQSEYIETTIKSVLNQDLDSFEHIVVDGGSTDGTIDILKKYKHLNWTSEKDSGQSNAVNKGFKIARGDIIAWINSDDYYEENIFKCIADFFKRNKNCYFLYGDITYVNKNNEIIKKLNGNLLSFNSLLRDPDLVRQPSIFFKRSILDKVGGLNEKLQLVMDLDFFLRIGKAYDFYYLNKNLSYYRTYPETKTLKFSRKQVREIYSVLFKHKIFISITTHKKLIKRYLNSYKFINEKKHFIYRP